MTDLVDFQQLQNLGLAQSAASAAEPQDVTQDEFLTLLLAQLENQDPLEPMDNTEFLSQLAEVTTASGIGELQDSFDGFASTIYADQALQASSLVGRNVMVASELARTDTAGQPISGAVDLENSSGQVTVDILDASGQLVRSIDLGVRRAGDAEFRWDGLDANGEVAGPGIYQFSARVTRGTQVESVPTLISTNVSSVSLGRSGEGVTVNSSSLGSFSFDAIRQIRE